MNLSKKSAVHLFNFNDEYFVMDSNSGALHIVDKPAFEIINKINQYKQYKTRDDKIYKDMFNEFKNRWSEGIIEKVKLELEHLIEQEQLFSELKINKIPVLNENQVKALCLNISHSCNMSCKYCFAEGGTFGEGKKKDQKAIMNFETAKNAVDFLLERSKERKNCEIDFFGGEPLLSWNVLKETVYYARDKASKYNKNIKFTLTTNGLLLNKEVINFLNEHHFAVVLSLDGRKKIHDSNRKDLKGKGTYDKIVPLYREFVESRNHKEYFIRGTFTSENIDFSNDVRHIAGLGFKDISLEPVVSSKEKEYTLENVNFDVIEQEYKNLALLYEEKAREGKGFSFFHFEIDLEAGPCTKKRLSGCGAGSEYLAVTPGGQIYPCHQFIGRSEFIMGNVNNNYSIDQDSQKVFEKNNFLGKDACKDCWAKLYCGGGCHANAYKLNGSLSKPYLTGCKMEKTRLECAFYLASKGVIQRYK